MAIHVMPGQGGVPIYGFIAVCTGHVQLTELSPSLRLSGLPNRCPVLLLAQLARDDRAPKGTGATLLVAAIQEMVRVSASVGCVGISLDAGNRELVKYYEGFGFALIGTTKNQTQKMYMRLDAAAASFAVA